MILHRLAFLLGTLHIIVGAHTQDFIHVIGEAGRNERGLTLHRTDDGMIFLGGSVGDSALVQRLDEDGSVVWSRAFKPGGQYTPSVMDIGSAPDGTIIGCGNGTVTAGAWLYDGFHFRMDVDGNFLWIRQWNAPEVYVKRILALDDNEYLLFGDHHTLTAPTYADLFTARVAAGTGDVNWTSPRYDLYSTIPYLDDVAAVAEIAGRKYAAGRTYVNGAPVSSVRTALSSFSPSGELIWSRHLIYPNNVNRRMYTSDMIAHDDSLTLSFYADITGSTTNYGIGLIRTDTLGNVAWARQYDIVGSQQEWACKVLSAPFGYVVSGRIAQGATRMFLIGVSHSGDLLWARSYDSQGLDQGLDVPHARNMVAMDDGFLFTANVLQGGNDRDILLVRTSIDGTVACGEVTDLDIVVTDLPTASFPNVTSSVSYAPGLDPLPFLASNAWTPPTCALLNVFGPDTTMCNALLLDATTDDATYLWQDGSTEATYTVSSSGMYWVTITRNCCSLTDSIMVMVDPGFSLDLGPDVVACEGQVVMVAVPGNFDAVLWSNGSTEAVLEISDEGTFTVDVSSGGCSTSDTISVSFIAPPVVDLGPDLTFCDGGAVLLDTGFPGLAHNWQDGSLGPTLLVEESGTYWVQVEAQGCTASDTIAVVTIPTPVVGLGPDTAICGPLELLLTVDQAIPFVLWQDGSTAPSYTATAPGTFWVAVEDQGCTASDTLVVDAALPPLVDLGPNVVECGSGPIVLDTGLDGLPHLWSTGEVTSSIAIQASGNHWVTVGPSWCSGTDTLQISLTPYPLVDLGPDTSICGPFSLWLFSGYPAANSTWQDGSQEATYQVTGPGAYSVLVDIDGCQDSASIILSSAEFPVLEVSGDTVLCGSGAVVVSASAQGGPIMWSNGSTDDAFQTAVPDTYVASVSNACGTVQDSVRVELAPEWQGLEDMYICMDEEAVVDLTGLASDVVWSNGSTGLVEGFLEGEHTYMVTDLFGCVRSGVFNVVQDVGADGLSYVPNTFTPNGDGLNDLFFVVGAERNDYQLQIFNRWGELIHSSMDPFAGWNGMCNGQDVPDGAYVYVLQHRSACSGTGLVRKIGHVTVLR